MAKQTHIIRLEDENGRLVEFERWPYKKAETCINHMIELYSTYETLYGKYLDKAARVVCYPTPDGATMEDPVWSVTAAGFRKLMEEYKNNI